jgi:EAL domain-containing protein (putative c-di-GMP-specific phosphodiesterase class I)
MQLREMGCEIGQGYYFAESLSRHEISTFLVTDLYY